MTFDSPSDLFFTPSVKAVQERRGSREAYARTAEAGGYATTITPDLAAFLAARDSVYLATASQDGQPYIQHRGGPPGFLRVLDERTFGWADFRGNRQYISLGNLAENPRAFLFAMDYAARIRVKIWGRARVVEDDPALVARLMPEVYRAKPEQAFLFTVEVWDANCPQHIPRKVNVAEVETLVRNLKARIERLEAELAAARAS
ncbi:MAG: pyridoxamine 5'-phosphate oxidase family protein [Methylobacteriaceae bacterium]|nr:pyridoxamine 5'-phosphate oxidase family protein [Methylobacteriaceae bacterium]